MKKVVVLGGGMVGGVMAWDLCREEGLDVTLLDVREENLAGASSRCGGRLRTVKADLSGPGAVARAVSGYDFVVGALSSRLGYSALRQVIEAGKDYCDISFFAEDALALDGLAREKGVTAVVDCGVAPGMSNMLAGWGVSRLDRAGKVEIYVGGLPRERVWPFEYKAGFSPWDVIEEYTRPSRVVEGGREVVKEALSEAELMDFAGVGTLEAFNTDGLRSLVRTLGVPEMVEKTMRYPGHIGLMKVFRHVGLFSEEAVEVPSADGGVARVRPRDVIARLMFPQWSYGPGEEDLTVMRVVVRGEKGGRASSLRWDLLDFYDRSTGATSMSRTTGLACTAVARLVMGGVFKKPGVIPPEEIGKTAGMTERVLGLLRERGVDYTEVAS
ncbi:MAG: saccharopine dehydrogenase NADP-binding domain-containing protein [Phycisphaeraceae bacterium]|nr:MAG: saccharopine dehydrogenase NADP-binding domain-containing protein [Phycisphaeraceae bacterium]